MHSSTNRRRRGDDRCNANIPLCPICHKPVRDLYSAITHRESGNPAHFDCILKILRESSDLLLHEKICYLGKGSFGIIQQRNSNSPSRFFIRKRIQYEPTDILPDWRKRLLEDFTLH